MTSAAKAQPPELVARENTMRPLLAGCCALLVMTVIAYLPVITTGGFIWDDDSYLTENPLITAPDGITRIWIPGETPQYYPLVFTSFIIEHRLWGFDPTGYHVVNIVLHAISAMLVWFVCRRIGVPGGVWTGWFIAALFALHPVHVESVAWITERKNVLSGVFYLAAMLAYLRFEAQRFGEGDGPARGSPWTWYAVALMLFICALLSKTVTCSLPAALILIMLFQRCTLSLRRLAPLAPLFVIGFALALQTALLERDLVGAGDIAELQHAPHEKLLIASQALLFYGFKMLWPNPLVFIYPRWSIDSAGVLAYWPVLVIVVITAGLVFAFVRGRRGIPLALAYFAGTLFPALGFVAVYPHRFSYVADHFNYLASLGVFVIIGSLAATLIQNRSVRIVGAAACLLLLGTLTWTQGIIYRSVETVFLHTVQHNPDSWMPHNNLAGEYLRQAKLASEMRDVDLVRDRASLARAHAEAAIAVKEDHERAHSNLASALILLGETPQAIIHAQRAAELRPEVVDYHVQLARFYAADEQFDASIAAMNDAMAAQDRHIADDPDNVILTKQKLALHAQMCELLGRADRPDDMLPHLRAILEENRDDFEALLRLAAVRERQGMFDQVQTAFTHAFRVTEQSPQGLLILLPRMISFYSSCKDPNYRDIDRALFLAQQLVEMTGRAAGSLHVLAAVYAQNKQYQQAVSIGLDALLVARQEGNQEMIDQIRNSVAEFQTQLDQQRQRDDDD